METQWRYLVLWANESTFLGIFMDFQNLRSAFTPKMTFVLCQHLDTRACRSKCAMEGLPVCIPSLRDKTASKETKKPTTNKSSMSAYKVG